MAVNISNAAQAGLLSQQDPPPLYPKPGKENIRLQKLLKKTAKKKAAAQVTQPSTPFRSSLSPVNEASPDLEHSDHSTPPKSPETPIYIGTVHPRISVRPLYQHVPSPYPHHREFTYGKTARFSPQPYVSPSHNVPQHKPTAVLNIVSPVPGHDIHATAPIRILVTDETTHLVMNLDSQEHTLQTSQNVPIHQPTIFNVSRTAKPLFEVPQMSIYTAKSAGLRTSYYASSPTRSRTPTAELLRGPTPTFEVRRIVTPTNEIRRDRTPTREIRRVKTPTFEIKTITTPTLEIKKTPTPTAEIKKETIPSSEIMKVRAPASEIKRDATPILETKRVTTQTLEKKWVTTPTLETKGATTPRVRTPTFDITLSKTSSGRPKTPSENVPRVRAPVIEISRPNPLLFAVSPVHMEGRRSKTPTSSLVEPHDEIQVNDTSLQNGGICVKSIQALKEDKTTSENLSKLEQSKAKPQIRDTQTTEISKLIANYHPKPDTPTTPSKGPAQSVLPLVGHQIPISRIPPLASQRPKTPTTKSTYYGLTPAEYVAHGGIKSYSPSFSISSTTVETFQLPKQEPVVPQLNLAAKEDTKPEVKHKEQSEIQPSQIDVIKHELTVAPPPSEFPKAAAETKSKSDGDIPKVSVPEETKSKVKITGLPDIKIPTIMVSVADIQPSEAPKAKTTKTVTPRVRTPTYGSPRLAQMTSIPQTVNETKKPGTKAAISSEQDVGKPALPNLSASQINGQSTKVPEKPTEAKMSLLERITKQNLASASSEKPPENHEEDKAGVKPLAKPKEDQKDLKTKDTKPEKVDRSETKVSTQQEIKPAEEKKQEGDSSPLTAEPLLKVIQKPKGMKSKLSGWSRLKKHMVVEAEEAKFPEPEPGSTKEVLASADLNTSEKQNKSEDEAKIIERQDSEDSPRAAKMWDAVLFQIFSTEENIMQQIEANKTEDQKKMEVEQKTPKEIPTFAHRLPVLLYSPRFDARRLREAVSRPATKIATVFEMGLIGRKNKDEEQKDFNRTARGFNASKTTDV
ncbi:muscle M-line assembly protein unc-89-like [Xyrauchen texanus]|uniref:muscle M-line assembly protein unc-89-like n=1 Tax=Xyrauchen texanus TaxID=154827 RepID=UPI00224289AB|nr:muscle M-line assembly protein unc-89-like [Xyrauchen texanus]